MSTDQLSEFPEFSPYSSTSGYTTDQPTYYQTEYEWQQQQQPQQQSLQPQQQQPMLESDRHQLYTLYPAGGEVTSHYSYQPQTGDYYQPNGIWPASQSPDSMAGVAQTQRFFTSIDLQQPRPHSSASSSAGGKPKRKRVQSHTQRKAANVRERRRMFHLNEAFDELRKRLPAFNYEKRLSRIETLRLAMTYISFMKDVSVGNDPKVVKLKPHGSDLSSDEMGMTPGPAMLVSHPSYSVGEMGEMVEKMMSEEESECSDTEHSNHSG